MIDAEHKWNRSLKPLITGFLLSLILILSAYWLTTSHLLSGLSMMAAILTLACIQALIQCLYFLNLGAESHPRWSLITFVFTVIVLIIVIGGSLWIMYNLDYNMMPPM